MIISLIAAMAHNRVIGKDNDLPWHLPADLKHFKQATLGKTIVMGRKTFDSMSKPLPKRRNIVLSQQAGLSIPGTEIFSSLQAALDALNTEDEVIIVGGGRIFTEALPLAHRMVLSFIDADIKGDIQFPDWNHDEWHEVSRKTVKADNENPHDFDIVTLERN